MLKNTLYDTYGICVFVKIRPSPRRIYLAQPSSRKNTISIPLKKVKNFYFSLLSTSETLKNPFLYNEMHNLTISHIKFVCYLDVKNFIPFFIKYTKRYSLLKTETILLVFFS